MTTCLYFGSFNPLHNGHLTIGRFFASLDEVSEVWYVLSPLSPFKAKEDSALIPAGERFEMLKNALKDHKGLTPCDIELQLPLPSFTARTLNHLSDMFPDRHFTLIMGEDSLSRFHLWKDFKKTLCLYTVFVYPRTTANEKGTPQQPPALGMHPGIKIIKAPVIDISSSKIRKMVRDGNDIRSLVPVQVWQTIRQKKHYAAIPPHA